MLLVCQILNICNYQVLFWFNFIKKMVTCKCYPHLGNYVHDMSNNLFHHIFFFFAIADLKNFTWCNVFQQIKKVSPNIGHQTLALVVNMRCHDLFCFGRPGLQADNFIYAMHIHFLLVTSRGPK